MSSTYSEILENMKNEFKNLAGFDADEASDIGIRLKVLAGEIFSTMASIDWLKNQMFPQTATASQLDLHAEQRGLTRKPATKARGKLTFSRQRSILYDITIPEGTVCATSGSDGFRYKTTETVVLPAGSLSVQANAEAELPGAASNTLAETITVMVTPPAAITSVSNALAFSGGTDSESDDDLRKRLIESYRNIPNGTNAAFYKECALQYDDVYSASAVSRAGGDGTVYVYVAGRGGVLGASVMKSIQDDINVLREINVDVTVKAPKLVARNVSVTLYPKDGYTFSDIEDECQTVISNYFSSLKIGEPYFVAGLGNAIFNMEGVKNYKFTSNNYSDYITGNDELVCLGTVKIIEGGKSS